MKITVVSTFMHDVKRFEEGSEPDVGEEEGKYFINNGWATSDEYAGLGGNQAEVKDIQIQDSSTNTSSEVK